MRFRIAFVLLGAGLLAACGGSGSSANNQNAPVPVNIGGGSVAKPLQVTVAGGQTASGINISLVTPATSPPPNAIVLGVAALSGAGQAFNTGATISQGRTQRVLLFGPGLSGSMQVFITGPDDITISSVQSIKATDNTPGVSFTAAVAPSAALGCRTVILQAANGDVTTFTSGLEVTP